MQGLLSVTLLLPIPGEPEDPNFMVTMAKADTSLHIPDQLFLFWEFQVQVSIRLDGLFRS